MAKWEQPAEDVDALLRAAIEQKRLVELIYFDKRRVVEPHDYGVHNGTVKLLAYQVGGSSSGRLPNWRWMEVSSISSLRLLDRTFAGGRGNASSQHHRWEQLFARVSPAAEQKPAPNDAAEADRAGSPDARRSAKAHRGTRRTDRL